MTNLLGNLGLMAPLLAGLAAVALAQTPTPGTCTIPDTTWNFCGTSCPLVCDRGILSGGGMCNGMCNAACFCPRGMALTQDRTGGRCIPSTDCEPQLPPPAPPTVRTSPPPSSPPTRPAHGSDVPTAAPTTSEPTSQLDNCRHANNDAGCTSYQVCNLVNVTVNCLIPPCFDIPTWTCQQDCRTVDCLPTPVTCPGGGRPRVPENECCATCPCDLMCHYGFAVDRNGNDLCECAAAPFSEPTVSPTQCYRSDNVPCRRYCEFGFAHNAQGCYHCECNLTPPPSDPPTRGLVRPTPSPTADSGCAPVQCEMHCAHGWQIDEATGCETCTCATGDRCTQGGAQHSHGSSWIDANNPCMQHSCDNGNVMTMAMSCMPDEVISREQCNGGNVTHSRDVCCGFCAEGPSEAPGTCTVTNRHTGPSPVVYADGDQWEYPDDACTTYICRAGEVLNISLQCDVQVCRDGQQPVAVDGQCCPECPDPIINQNCTDPATGVVHLHTDEWVDPADPCMHHQCNNGRIISMAMGCPPPGALTCRHGFEVGRVPGVCCPQCVAVTSPPAPSPPTCGPVCSIFCEYGHVEDAHGCPTCQCASAPPSQPPRPVCNPPCTGVLGLCNLVESDRSRLPIPTCQQDCRLVRCAHNIICADGSNGTIPENMCCPICPDNPGTLNPTPAPTLPRTRRPTPAPNPVPSASPTASLIVPTSTGSPTIGTTPDPCAAVQCTPCSLNAFYADDGTCCGTCLPRSTPEPSPTNTNPSTDPPTNRNPATSPPTDPPTSRPRPTDLPTSATPVDPSGSTGKENDAESSTVIIVVVVAAVLILVILAGFLLVAAKSKAAESERTNFDNPLYADVVLNDAGPQNRQYESSAPTGNEMDC